MANEVTGKIAEAGRGQIPESFAALMAHSSFGPEEIVRRVNSIKMSLFGEVINTNVEDALDVRVIEYAGKLLALSLITPAVDYWSKQAQQIGARGQNENKGYGDRSARLLDIRALLLEETRLLLPEIQTLLPRRSGPKAGIARVQAGVGLTPDPMSIEPPFGTR
jgi:hypothetical protein